MMELDSRIDIRYYGGRDLYSDGEETEKHLLELVSSAGGGKAEEQIAGEATWPVLYHLSPLRENILNWLPFQAGERVLELGAGCGAVTGAFLGKGMQVDTVDLSLMRSRINAARHPNARELRLYVGKMEEVLPRLTERYDYITLIGVLEYASVFSEGEDPYADILKKAAALLKPAGSVWAAIENRLGLKYFSGCREDHTGRYFDGIEGYPGKNGPRTFSRKELADLGERCGFCCSFYYPYPDYKLPVKIFSDAFLPRPGELSRNWQNFDGSRLALFEEGKSFDGVLSAGLFPEMSNSFLVRFQRPSGGEK